MPHGLLLYQGGRLEGPVLGRHAGCCEHEYTVYAISEWQCFMTPFPILQTLGYFNASFVLEMLSLSLNYFFFKVLKIV